MKRIEKVHKMLTNYDQNQPVSAKEVAENLGITRANASNDLNQLVKTGKAEKCGTKPVCFYAVKSSLAAFIEKNPSLAPAVDQLKAAVLYPPQRMHILLSGETGVGKSMFAELAFQFSQEQKVIEPDAKLVVFNCADYAHNAQLITGNIFGISKGAYTGADADREGLIEKADGGILLLDEIHRLPPEAQEMLFTFIDKKVYRRLGETAGERSADVQIIGATTEDASSALLQTFLRRIPMRIQLPNLKERGIVERLNLISGFFNEEAHKLKLNIVVSMNTLRALLGYECKNNIGQLKSDIQLLCARSYARQLSDESGSMSVSSYDLPATIKEGLYNVENRSEIWSILPSQKDRFILFKKDDYTTLPIEDYQEKDIYQLIDQKLEDMEKIGLNQRAAMDIIDLTIKDYFAALRKKNTINEENIISIVGNEIFATTRKVIQKAEELLQQSFEPDAVSGLSLHLYSMISRLRNGEVIKNPRLEQIKEEYPKYFQAALQCKYLIETAFSISLPDDEAGFMTMFFIPQELASRKNKPQKVNIAVIAHGESTATSIADVVNTLLGDENAAGFNMPLSYEPQSILEELKAYYIQKETEEDILLLVDMGSLSNFAGPLTEAVKGQVRCIDLVSTLHVLEASRKATLGYSLEDIAEAVLSVSHNEQEPAELGTPDPKMQEKIIIVTSCTTGEGSAKVIKDLLLSKLERHDGRCEIKSLQVTGGEDFKQQIAKIEREGKIICCIGTFSIPSLPYPQISISELLTEGTFQKIQKKVDYELTFLGMQKNIAPMIRQLDGTTLLNALKNWVENISLEMKLALTAEIMIGLICHLACVIDKDFGNKSDNTSTKSPEVSNPVLEANIRILEEMYDMVFSEKEVRYVCQYLGE